MVGSFQVGPCREDPPLLAIVNSHYVVQKFAMAFEYIYKISKLHVSNK